MFGSVPNSVRRGSAYISSWRVQFGVYLVKYLFIYLPPMATSYHSKNVGVNSFD